MKNNMKKLGALLMMAGLVGCASVESVSKKVVENDKKSGVIYAVNVGEARTIKQVCDAIKNADSRCAEQDKYTVVTAASKVGYADGFVGAIALATKDIIAGEHTCSARGFNMDNSCTYYKVLVEPKKLATVLEVASKSGENKCYWSGLRKAGGVVCPAYNWDYRKDNQAAIPQ